MRPPWSDGCELLGRLGVRGGAGRRRTGPEPAEGRSRRTEGGSGPTTSIRSAGGACTNRMTAETLGVASGHFVLKHMHMGRYDHPEVLLTLFRSILQSYAVESQIQIRQNKRNSNFRCCIQALDSTTCVAASPWHPDLTACLSSIQDRTTISILAAA